MARIDQLLDRARSRLDRVPVDRVHAELDAGAVLVDIRPIELRQRDGEIHGALVIDRNQLEWRLDPTSDTRIVDLREGQRVILFCDEAYASSLAAIGLHELGLTGATDLIGGYQAYRARYPEDTTTPAGREHRGRATTSTRTREG